MTRKGAQALEFGTYGKGRKRGRKGSSPHLKSQIVLVQKENPSFGLKKVRDFLYRFRGLKCFDGDRSQGRQRSGAPTGAGST